MWTKGEKGRRRDQASFIHKCRKALRKLPGSSDFSRFRKERYREFVAGSASDPFVERLMNNPEFLLIWRLALNVLSLFGLNYKAGQVDMPDCPRWASGLEEMTVKARFGFRSRSGRLASNPSSSYRSTLVTLWTILTHCIKVRSGWCFS